MRLKDFSRLAALCAGAILCTATVSAQTCQIQGVTVGGYYTFASIGNGAPGSLLTPPATGTSGGSGSTAPGYSATELGELLNGLANGVPFASSGTIYLNGAGSIIANSPTGVPTVAGSYVLNSDCTITVTLSDVFGTITTKAILQGVVFDNGAEIDLGVLTNVNTGTSSTSGSTGTGSTGTSTTSTAGALYESNVLVHLIRPPSAACSVSSLEGSYVLSGTGTGVATVAAAGSTSSTQTEAPFFWFASIDFDGNGNVIIPSVVPSALSYLQYTGSYKVNADCTGTMTLKSNTGASSSTTGTSSTTSSSALSVYFILSQPTVPFNPGNPSQQASSPSPGIEFSLSSGTETLSGRGIAQ
jgi:hypothetical protein